MTKRLRPEERAVFRMIEEIRERAGRAEVGLSEERVLALRQESSIDRYRIRETLAELEYLAMSRVAESQVVSSHEAARN